MLPCGTPSSCTCREERVLTTRTSKCQSERKILMKIRYPQKLREWKSWKILYCLVICSLNIEENGGQVSIAQRHDGHKI